MSDGRWWQEKYAHSCTGHVGSKKSGRWDIGQSAHGVPKVGAMVQAVQRNRVGEKPARVCVIVCAYEAKRELEYTTKNLSDGVG